MRYRVTSFGPRQRRMLAVAAASLVFAVAAGTAQAAGPASATIFHKVHLKSNTVVTETVTCPRGYVAVAGGVSSGKLMLTGPSGFLLSSRSAGGPVWKFRLGNPVTSPDTDITLSVRCLRIGAKKIKPKKRVKVKTVSQTVTVPPGQVQGAQLTCPPGNDLTSPGFDDMPSSGNKRVIAATAAFPANFGVRPFLIDIKTEPRWATGEVMVFDNPASMPVVVRAQAVCANIHTFLQKGSADVPPGKDVKATTARCKHGVALGGAALADDHVKWTVGASRARGRKLASLVYDFFNSAPMPLPVQIEQLCSSSGGGESY